MNKKMRLYHRYLGFFLAGIMAVYALSGIVLVFRDTDTFKKEVSIVKELPAGITTANLGKELKIKGFEVVSEEGSMIYFKGGSYNAETRIASYTKKELPYLLDKMTHLHKATSSRPLAFLNIFFGISLFFFVISSFWMFSPSSNTFKKGLYFAGVGLVLTLILLFI